MLIRTLIVAVALIMAGSNHSTAFTVSEAQACADKLLTSYNNKTYPKKLLAIDKIVLKAFGRGNYLAMSQIH